MAVIDAFVRSKFPKLSFDLSQSDKVEELVAVNRAFFSNDAKPPPSTTSQLDGAYLALPKISERDLSSVVRKVMRGARADWPFRSVYAYIIRVPSPRYYVVHYVEFPVRLSHLEVRANFYGKAVDPDDHERVRKILFNADSRRSDSETIIRSGIGYPLMHSNDMICVLRDRTTYRPWISHLNGTSQVLTENYERRPMVSFYPVSWVRAGSKSHLSYQQEVLAYTGELCDIIEEYYNKLAMEF